jgi:hypothetical protein
LWFGLVCVVWCCLVLFGVVFGLVWCGLVFDATGGLRVFLRGVCGVCLVWCVLVWFVVLPLHWGWWYFGPRLGSVVYEGDTWNC